MQQQPLNYQPQAVDVRTFEWRWDYSEEEWEASLRAPDGEQFRLRRDATSDIVRAVHAGEAWSLQVDGSKIYARRDGESLASATVRGREIEFSGDTTVRKDSGGLILMEQIRFMRGADVLLTFEQLFWSKSGRCVRVTTKAAGATFPGRILLVLLAFHEIVVRDMSR